jgi:hypothetical protein
MKTTLWVVAVNQAEAEALAGQTGHARREDAGMHLKAVQAPPADSYYAGQYKVFAVEAGGAGGGGDGGEGGGGGDGGEGGKGGKGERKRWR